MTTNAEECWTLREHRRQLDPALFGPAPARDERFLEKRRWIECANFPNDHPLRIIEFFHRQMNEELNGVENGAESLADSPDADWKVLMSIARRCADEARHVEMFRRTFEIQGGKLGEYPGLPWFLQPSVPFRGLSAHRLDRSKIRFTLAKAVPWAGKYILHSSHRMMTPSTCSGDTLYDFVQALCFLGEAFATALLSYFLDRHQANYERIHGWLRFYIRLSVGAAMLMYGSEKILRMNFQQPNLYKILALLGDYSLMGWARMGASGSYSIFAGCG